MTLSITLAHAAAVWCTQEELALKQHTQLQLTDLLHTAAGNALISQFRSLALAPFIASGMHVAAFEVVFSQHNIRPKAAYKGFHIANKLGCHHQDLRMDEPWFGMVGHGNMWFHMCLGKGNCWCCVGCRCRLLVWFNNLA